MCVESAKEPQELGAGVRVLVNIQEAPGRRQIESENKSGPISAPVAVPATGQGRAGSVHKSVRMVLSQRKSMPGTSPVFKGNE